MKTITITGENLNQQIIQAIKNAVAKASNPTYTIKYINTSKDKIDSEALQDIEDAKLGAKLYSEYLASGSKSTSWADIKKENKIRFSDYAKEKFNELDGSIKKPIQKFLDRLEESDDPRSSGKGLTENLSGLWRYRVKNYRLICFIQDEELIVLFLDISKRDEVYTDRNVKSILKNVPTK